MPLVLLAVVAAVPVLDIISLIVVGEAIGVWWTLAGVLLAGLLGSALLRIQGIAAAAQGRKTLEQGRFPAREVFDGACILFGGGLLMLPGFVSDALGVLLLTPFVRGWVFRMIERRVQSSGRFMVWSVGETTGPGRPPGSPGMGPGMGPVIEGEFEPLSDPASDPENSGSRPPGPGGQDDSPWRRSPATRPGMHHVVPSDNP